jgi:hypothetical protein
LAGLVASASIALAQDNSTTVAPATAQPTALAPAPAAAPVQLPYGASQILQLAPAKIADNTIVAYIRNSGNSYNLNADQIIYLQQQGISTTIINAMLSQPRLGVYSAPAGETAGTPAPQPDYSQPQQPPTVPTSAVGPAVTAIDPTAAAASSYVYYQPAYYPTYYSYPYPYYYPAYGWYPGISVGFVGGWGHGWRGGYVGGWHGGYGGWHGGGGYHGGGGFHR